tara:strand:+ start:11414 stop:12085 length:672 start_codon:yes stop_codon:yes gene_type:complete
MPSRNKNSKPKKRWPTKAVMDQIYENSMWGGADYDFYSGDGSHEKIIVEPYVRKINEFLSSFDSTLSVLDLGCGDFNVGYQLLDFTEEYIAVDIVSSLISRNQEKFVHEKLLFKCLDISKNKLPKADCVLVRQVLQHLSNAEILSILPKLKSYKYVILTEHIPSFDFVSNKDMVTSMGNRLKQKSGIVLTDPPFNYKPMHSEELVRILVDDSSIIQTIVYQNF